MREKERATEIEREEQARAESEREGEKEARARGINGLQGDEKRYYESKLAVSNLNLMRTRI